MPRARALGAAAAAFVCAVAGCGFPVQSPDLFVLTRTGQGKSMSLLVNDSGTVRCNGGHARNLTDPMLLAARDLSSTLDNDAKSALHLPPTAKSVYEYSVKLPDGTISFPDTAGLQRTELAQAEQFFLQIAQSPCGLTP